MSETPKSPKPAPKWLIAYNTISACLWASVLGHVSFLGYFSGQPTAFEKTNYRTTLIQTLALVEVFNAAAGIVRAGVVITGIQVYSRLLVTWGIWQFLPNSPANGHWSYITVSVAWALSEVIKYSYHAASLKGKVPYFLVYLRYTAFLVLYPLGVSSEMIIMYLSLNDAQKWGGDIYCYFLWINLGLYIPALNRLYRHLLKQRSKVLGNYNSETKNR